MRTSEAHVMKFIERQKKIKWFGDLVRRDPAVSVGRACNMKMGTHRGRGRSRRRWIEAVTDTLQFHNTTIYQPTQHAQYLYWTPIIGQGIDAARHK